MASWIVTFVSKALTTLKELKSKVEEEAEKLWKKIDRHERIMQTAIGGSTSDEKKKHFVVAVQPWEDELSVTDQVRDRDWQKIYSVLHHSQLQDLVFSTEYLHHYNSGELPRTFTRGFGLQDWQVESAKLINPDLSTGEIMDLINRVADLRSDSPIVLTDLFLSYSHADSKFVDRLQKRLENEQILSWRDVHDAPAGPLERIVIDNMKNRTVLLILSGDSVNSDWVEFEAKKARELAKELGRDVLCPIALDDAWKTCKWEGRLRDQIEKYNILDFSGWKDEERFENGFRLLKDGLGIYFAKGRGDTTTPPTSPRE